MRKTPFTLVIALGGFVLGAATLLGCGDKFVVLGRGVRFQRVYTAMHPASILLYMNPASHMPAADQEYQLQATLKLAGHKATTVGDAKDLRDALAAKHYDIVLADLPDAGMLEGAAAAVASKPAVIPLVYNPTEPELKAAEKQYSCLVKTSRKSHQLLAVIDEAMEAKQKGTVLMCAASK